MCSSPNPSEHSPPTVIKIPSGTSFVCEDATKKSPPRAATVTERIDPKRVWVASSIDLSKYETRLCHHCGSCHTYEAEKGFKNCTKLSPVKKYLDHEC